MKLPSIRSLLALVVSLTTVATIAQQGPRAAKSLDQMSGPECLHCAVSSECEYDSWDLADAIRKKFTIRQLIDIYPREANRAQQVIVISLAKNKSAQVVTFMRQAALTGLRSGMTDEDNHYFALQYLADRCDPDALRELNRSANFRDSYPVGCMFWQDTLEDFGKCSYHPAIRHLARSLNSACVNNIQAAEDSLRHLMPKSPCWKKAGLGGDFQQEAACYLRQAGPSIDH